MIIIMIVIILIVIIMIMISIMIIIKCRKPLGRRACTSRSDARRGGSRPPRS